MFTPIGIRIGCLAGFSVFLPRAVAVYSFAIIAQVLAKIR
jgi:hypothetical protein